MVSQIFHGGVLAIVLLAGDSGRGCARAIARTYHLIKGALIVMLHLLLDAAVLDHEEAPGLAVAPARGAHARLQNFANQLVGDGIWFQTAHGTRGAHDVKEVGSLGHT